MLGSYVCRQCRAQLTRRIVPVRNPQWQRQPRATFFSLRNQTGKPQHAGDAARAEDSSQQENLAEEGQNQQGIRHTDNTEHVQPQSRGGRYSRLVEDDVGADDELAPASALNIKYTDPVEAKAEALARRGPATAIEEALARRGNVDKAWGLFEKNFTSMDCEALTKPPESDVAFLANGQLFDDILREVNSAFCNARVKPATTPTTVLFRYEQLGLATPEHWIRQTLAYITHQAILAVNAPPEDPSRDLIAILFELVSLWRLFFQCRGRQVQLDSLRTDWNLPAIETMPNTFDSPDFNLRLHDYHPGLVGNSTLGFCAVYFYTLSSALSTVEPLHKEAEHFIRFLGRILPGSRVSSVFRYTQRAQRFTTLPENVQREITKEIDNAPRKAMAELASEGAISSAPATGARQATDDRAPRTTGEQASLTTGERAPQTTGERAPQTTDDRAANREAFHLNAIARAVKSNKSPVALETLWKAAMREFMEDGKIAIPPRVYNAFLSGFVVLRKAPRSVDVWNHMIEHGVRPDIQTWVALLQGCAEVRDVEGFNAMWTRMLDTGIEPDIYAWTTRIHGLFRFGKVNQGLAALDDMAKRWQSAEDIIRNPPRRRGQGAKKLPSSAKAINECTKPSIEVINGAITAIVQQAARFMYHDKRVAHVQKILAWARSFDIKPDAITYNSLIRLYLHASDFATAFNVLRQMEKSGIEADIATHTMLINVAFQNLTFDGLTEAQQTEKIIAMLNDLEAGGLPLNDYVYSTAIDRLLKQYSNYTAVRQIVEHMHARNKVPAPHAYTSLITFYFQQDPPAMAAVDSLVHQFFTAHRLPKDRVLFDRLIEGYASHGEVGKMMSVLTRMSKQTTAPGWDALIVVIEALVRAGDYDRARQIVRDVERGQGIGEGGIISGKRDEKDFFYVANNLGVGLGDEQMGDFMMADKAIRANPDEKILGEQLREQEIQQMTQREEMQEDVHGFLKDDHEDIHSRVNR
jgi:pentatricopeptide repeat protein